MRHHQFHVRLLAQTISGCLVWLLTADVRGQEVPPLQLASPIGSAVSKTGQSPQGRFVVGRLERVRRGDSGTTRFALIDEEGQLAAFVAPTTRFDLRSMLGNEIGVQATTFTEADDTPPYLIADNVVPMHQPHPRPADSEKLISGRAAATSGRVVPASAVMSAAAQQPGQSPAPTPADPQIRHPRVAANDGSWEVLPADTPIPLQSHLGSPAAVCSADCTGVCGPVCEVPCNTCAPAPCTCGPPGWLWVRGEYLAWWASGMDTPPLVTTSPDGTPPGEAGVLGADGTDILFGDEGILDGERSGFRIRFGGWFGPQRRFGYEGEYFELSEENLFFEASSDGNGFPILARPFFNINPRLGGDGDLDPPAREDSELVSYPGLLAGTVTVAASSELRSAAGRVRWNVCCKQCCRICGSCNPCSCRRRCGYPPFMKIDLIAGYRYMRLDESLVIQEDLTSLQADNPGRFEISDEFRTENRFNGGEVGASWEGGWNRWTLEMLMNVALGSVRQEVNIDGSTTISPFVSPEETFPGGLLALSSNIGNYQRDEFAVIPQLGTNLGLYVTPRMRVIVGYTLVYWSRVARPGDQIDLQINPDLVPPERDPVEGPLSPQFVFRDTDFWAQGLNVGLDYRW